MKTNSTLRSRLVRHALAGLALGCSFLLQAAELPPLQMPMGVGVNIHFNRGHETDLDRIAEGGFKYIRMDFSWQGTERKKGEYDWSAYDELTANLEKRGLRSVYILDYSSSLYEDTYEVTRNGKPGRELSSPRKPESVAAFAQWAAAAARHFKGHAIVWEIWNEPNIDFWKPRPDASQYATMALATLKAMREADPQATIVAPASSEFPWKFLETFFASGALAQLDAVSVHPYRGRPPETVGADYLRLRGLIEKYAPAGPKKQMPILSGEWGYSTHLKGVSQDTQAAYLARQQLINLLHGVPLSIWYDWKNDGTDPKENEHNFGTVLPDLTPKPSYRAAQTMTRELSGFRVVRRMQLPNAQDYVLLLANAAGQQKLAAWTLDKPHMVSLDLNVTEGNATAVSGQGQPIDLKNADARLQVELNDAPQYISFKKPVPALQIGAAWSVASPMPVSIEAGDRSSAKITVQLTNPFPYVVVVQVGLVSQLGTDRVTSRLNPKQSVSREMTFSTPRRDLETVSVTLDVEYLEAGARNKDRSLGHWEEQREFLVANPLHLSLAPVEKGYELRVQNPGLAALKGKVVTDHQSFPVILNAQIVETVVELPKAAMVKSQKIQLLDSKGYCAAQLPGQKFVPMENLRLQASLDGNKDIPATATLVATNAPEGVMNPFPKVYQLDYQFESGWRFVRCAAQGAPSVEGNPNALGLWVCSDRSENLLRMRIMDAGGQTFQVSGPALDWTGWRWITFDLTHLENEGHWGGANDGKPHGAFRLDCPLLVDGSNKKTGGKLLFSGLTWIYAGNE